MRRLSRKKALNLVKELDAFPKVSESYVETSATGGTGQLTLPQLTGSGEPPLGREVTICLCLSDSLTDSFWCYGASGCLRVFCLPWHLDEVWIWSGQRFLQVNFNSDSLYVKALESWIIIFFCTEWLENNITLHVFSIIYSKLRINIDITVAMRCQRKYLASIYLQWSGTNVNTVMIY